MTARREITQRDLCDRSDEIMDAIERGERFILTRLGTPIGEFIPLRRHRVTRAQFAAMSANAPAVNADRYRADLDATADTELRDPYAR